MSKRPANCRARLPLALSCRPPWAKGNSITSATWGISRYTGATQGSAPTVRRSPRACRRRKSGSVITASPIHWGAMIKEWGRDPNSLVPGEVLTRLQFVNRAAIRALGLAGVGDVQVDLGVAVPDFHVSLGAGAVHATLVVEVLGQEFDNRLVHILPQMVGDRAGARCVTAGCPARSQTLLSQCAYLGLRPLTMSK